jgi:hypothetical protein
MKDLLDDIQSALQNSTDDGMDPVHAGGGILQLQDPTEIPEQFKTPAVGLIPGDINPTHFAGKVRWMIMPVMIVIYTRICDQIKKISGRLPVSINANIPASTIAKTIRTILDYDRFGKYAGAYYRGEGTPILIKKEQNEFYVGWPLNMEYRKAEFG